MKRKVFSFNFLYTIFFVGFIFLILTNSEKSLAYALNGLNLWFTKMIPALLPFMIISGVMIRLQLTENFVLALYPILHPLFRVRKNVCYAIIMGFLCGFPMGAKVTVDLLKRGMITEREAKFLLSFCNNIGPVYFCSFVLPLLHRKLVFPYIFGMYGLPFLYGIFLRYFSFSDLSDTISSYSSKELQTCEQAQSSLSLLEQIDNAITVSMQSILILGGYMILFNLCNLIPDIFSSFWGSRVYFLPKFFAPILEITGGLGILGDSCPLVSLLLLPFGGLSCIAQTYSILKTTNLSIHSYVIHKFILSGITGLYYLGWFFLFPSSFLQ